MSGMPDGWQRIVRELQNTIINLVTPVGQTGMVGPTVTECAVSGDWYPVTGTFTDETDINEGFSVVEGVFKSLVEAKTTFGGSGNFAVNKTCELTIGLFVNGVNLEKANTCITFAASARTLPASRTVALLLNVDDELDIRVKSDTTDTNVTVDDLNALFIGLRS